MLLAVLLVLHMPCCDAVLADNMTGRVFDARLLVLNHYALLLAQL